MEIATFWYGCNVLRHGDIINNCIDLLKIVGIEADPVGGPNYCCGSIKDSNPTVADGMARRTVGNMNRKGHAQMIAWCPSCHLQMDDFMAQAYEANFTMTYIVEVLHARRELLKGHLIHDVPITAFLHRHVGFQHKLPINQMVLDLLALIPGLTVLDDPYLAPGYMCHALGRHPAAMQSMLRYTADTVRENSINAIITIYHQCYRDLCGLEKQGVSEVFNYIHLLAQSAGITRVDDYKTWKNKAPNFSIIDSTAIERMGGQTTFETLIAPELNKLPLIEEERVEK